MHLLLSSGNVFTSSFLCFCKVARTICGWILMKFVHLVKHRPEKSQLSFRIDMEHVVSIFRQSNGLFMQNVKVKLRKPITALYGKVLTDLPAACQ